MQETTSRSIYDERTVSQDTFDILRGLDKNVHDLSSELYVFRRENERRLTSIEADISALKKDTLSLQQDNASLKNEVAELKQEIKDLRRDVSDIKGDIKAIIAGFGAAQNRFNWGLVILGIFVALIQLLK